MLEGIMAFNAAEVQAGSFATHWQMTPSLGRSAALTSQWNWNCPDYSVETVKERMGQRSSPGLKAVALYGTSPALTRWLSRTFTNHLWRMGQRRRWQKTTRLPSTATSRPNTTSRLLQLKPCRDGAPEPSLYPLNSEVELLPRLASHVLRRSSASAWILQSSGGMQRASEGTMSGAE